jgi:hypothetical protein
MKNQLRIFFGAVALLLCPQMASAKLCHDAKNHLVSCAEPKASSHHKAHHAVKPVTHKKAHPVARRITHTKTTHGRHGAHTKHLTKSARHAHKRVSVKSHAKRHTSGGHHSIQPSRAHALNHHVSKHITIRHAVSRKSHKPKTKFHCHDAKGHMVIC